MNTFVIEQSTAILFGMVCAIIALIFLVAILADQVIRQNAALADDDEVDHAMCIAFISDVVSKRVVAMAFRDAADRWESVEEKANLIELGSEKFKVGGPSMPSLWLHQQADTLDPPR